MEQGLADALLRRDALRATLTGNDLETCVTSWTACFWESGALSRRGDERRGLQLYELYREAPRAWHRLRVPRCPASGARCAFAFLEAAAAQAKSKSMARAIEEISPGRARQSGPILSVAWPPSCRRDHLTGNPSI